MRRRNWKYLSRKLVDTSDLSYSFDSVQFYMAQQNAAFYGEGVLPTTQYPNPFPITLSATQLAGVVGKGIAYDQAGFQVRIDDTFGSFLVSTADPSLNRQDLLVLRYKAVGDTVVPEPDQPTQTTFLNIVDGYQLVIIPGTPSSTPTYPAKGLYDVILAGIQVTAGAASSSGLKVDLSIREMATPVRAFFPVFKQEVPAGTVDGNNQNFSLSFPPLDQNSTKVSVDGLILRTTDFVLSGQSLTLNFAPTAGSDVYAEYIVNASGSVNPVTEVQEVPTGTIDGMNQTFLLAGQPVDQGSLRVYVNSLIVPTTLWSLNQSPTQSQIVFNAGAIPAVGSDVYAVYLRNAVASAQAQSGGSSGGGSGSGLTPNVEYPVLSASDIANGFVTLSHVPAYPMTVLLDVISQGGPQQYGADFVVSSNKLTWSGGLSSTDGLIVGSKLRISYMY